MISNGIQKNIIIRYAAPTKFDVAPAKTIWAITTNTGIELYIQLNNDSTTPQWERVGSFLEKSFIQLLESTKFVNECYRLYKHYEDDPENKIMDMLHIKK